MGLYSGGILMGIYIYIYIIWWYFGIRGHRMGMWVRCEALWWHHESLRRRTTCFTSHGRWEIHRQMRNPTCFLDDIVTCTRKHQPFLDGTSHIFHGFFRPRIDISACWIASKSFRWWRAGDRGMHWGALGYDAGEDWWRFFFNSSFQCCFTFGW